MTKPVKKPQAFSFAHLIGLGGTRAEDGQGDNDDNQDDPRKQRDDESDEDYAKRMEELDKKEADDGQDDPDADDDSGESDKEKAARAKERARCAAIFDSKAAAGRPDVAAHLAFATNMSASEAVSLLGTFAAGAAAPASKRASLGSRMAGVTLPNVGASAPAAPGGAASSAANMILAAGRARRGEA